MNLSEALSTFDDHLPDIRKACVENVRFVQSTHSPYKELDVDAECTAEDIHQAVNHYIVVEKTKLMLLVINRIDGRNKHYKKDSIIDEDIQKARDYPIAELFEELTGQAPRHGMVKCCFHNDKTASMSLRRHNRYKCFGCDAKGDVIDLYMKVQGVDFISAIKKLI